MIIHVQHYFFYFISQNNGHDISWKHLEDLYQDDMGKGSGVTIVPKLKREHIKLTSFSKIWQHRFIFIDTLTRINTYILGAERECSQCSYSRRWRGGV